MGLAYERMGSGPTLVLLHGVGHRRQAWGAVLDRLTPHRDVIIADLPGHGESPPLEEGKPALEAMLGAVTALLDDLGLERPHVAGNSLGGTVAGGPKARRPRPPRVRGAKARRPQARIRPLPGGGHVPMTDDPALVADVLLQGSGRLAGQPA